MTMAAMVAVIYRLSGLIGCLLGEQIVVVGISGSGLMRMVEFQVLRPGIDEAGERPPWQPQIAGQSVRPVDKLSNGGCSCGMWSPYAVRFKTLAAKDYHIIEKFLQSFPSRPFYSVH